MIHGHVQIDLHNVNSGSNERIEKDNMITNAVKEILPYQFGYMANEYYPYNHTDYSNSKIFPISQKMLGGIMLFDGKLTEDAAHFYFPSEAHLIGFIGRTLDTSHSFMGSFNSLESGASDTGYTAVWDFNTSQCNGDIASLGLTHARISNGLFTGADLRGFNRYCLEYDEKNQTQYYMNGSEIRKRRNPSTRFKLNDSLWENNSDKLVKDAQSISNETLKSVLEKLGTNLGYQNDPYDYYRYIDGKGYGYWCDWADLAGWEWGQNGKLYLSFLYPNKGVTTLYVLPMSATDYSFSEEDLITITFEAKMNARNDKRCISNGYLYIISYDNAREVIRVNLSNTVDQHTYTLDKPADLISALPYGGAKVYYTGNYDANKACDILYPDGETRNFADKGQGAYSMWGCGGWLGTICNLGTAIEKTSAQTMKITYTLTDVEESEETTTTTTTSTSTGTSS